MKILPLPNCGKSRTEFDPCFFCIVMLLMAFLTGVPWTGVAGKSLAGSFAPPTVTYPEALDQDQNLILDPLDRALLAGEHRVDGLLEVVVVLWQEPLDEDIQVFVEKGGEVIEVWKYAAYAIWGRIPAGKLPQLPAALGDRLCYIGQAGESDGFQDLLEATTLIRARTTVWNSYGYTGDADGSIAIIDTGIDGPHDDVGDPDGDDMCNDPADWNDACNVGWDPAYRIQGWNDIYGTSQGSPLANPVDYGNHGTLVAGCAAGDGSVNSNYQGVAPASHLVGVRIASNSGNFSSTRAISAMNWIIANKTCLKVKVANLSSSYNPSNPSLIMNAANNVVANGIVLTCSAGNLFCNYPVLYPGRADKVITVGATNDQDRVAGYSSNGPSGVAKPDLMAPGGSAILGTGPITGPDNVCDEGYPANDYQDNQGTSFSAPIVAGAASLLIDAWEQADGFSWGWTEYEARTIKSILVMTACEVDTIGEDRDGAGGCPPNSPGTKDRGDHDLVEGYGRINLDAAVEALTMNLAPNSVASATLGGGAADKKVWARKVGLTGPCVRAVLSVPPNADYDLYLYSNYPAANGIPGLVAKSVTPVAGSDEEISLEIGFVSDTYFLVVKWVSGAGPFDLYFTDGSSANFLDVTSAPVNDSSRGAGVAWGDYDNDGDDDLFLANTSAGNKLFANQGDGSFVEETASGVSGGNRSRTGTWGDYDVDGDLDLYVVNWSEANTLYRNNGDGTFGQINTAPLNDAGFGEGAVWGDYDGDGYLDIYLVNSNDNRLFRNQGDGTFSDETTAAGVADTGTGYSASWVDFDNDRDLDLYVCNFGPNRLFQNNGDGTFSDAADVPLGASSASSWGHAWGDYDGDGDLDLYVVNYYDEANVLFRNDGEPGWTFTDVTTGVLGDTGDGTGAVWVDFDNDADLDLYLMNASWNFPVVANKLFRNDNGAFFDATGTVLPDEADSYGAAWADMDADGDLDLYQANWMDQNRLYKNDTCRGNNYIKVRVDGSGAGKAVAGLGGIGARVRIVAGGKAQIQEISGGVGYGQNSQTVHFGLGIADLVDTLQVIRPGGGTMQELYDLEAGQLVRVNQSLDPVPDPLLQPRNLRLRPNVPNPFNPSTTIEYTIARPGLVGLKIYDLSGNLVRILQPPTNQDAGLYEVRWDGRDGLGQYLGSGVYLVRLQFDRHFENRKVMLLK